MARLTSQDTVRVVGLNDLRKELRKLDEPGLIDGLKEANYEVAALVVSKAKARAASVGRMQAKAADTLTAQRAQARAQVSFGGAKAPFAAGAEFGAGRNQRRFVNGRAVQGWNQFEDWRGNGRDAGFFLYPSIREATPEIVEKYGDAIDKLTKQAFPD